MAYPIGRASNSIKSLATAKEFDEISMNAATSWTAVTSEAIRRFRVGESEGSGRPNNLVPCQKRQLRRLRCRKTWWKM
ncbi:MAG: hypothetical protein O2960_14775 [Verrucomicrobia bacterium]|nr:hypothetical protein [Verrucomicrobiota bacterium]